ASLTTAWCESNSRSGLQAREVTGSRGEMFQTLDPEVDPESWTIRRGNSSRPFPISTGGRATIPVQNDEFKHPGERWRTLFTDGASRWMGERCRLQRDRGLPHLCRMVRP